MCIYIYTRYDVYIYIYVYVYFFFINVYVHIFIEGAGYKAGCKIPQKPGVLKIEG